MAAKKTDAKKLTPKQLEKKRSDALADLAAKAVSCADVGAARAGGFLLVTELVGCGVGRPAPLLIKPDYIKAIRHGFGDWGNDQSEIVSGDKVHRVFETTGTILLRLSDLNFSRCPF